MPLTEADADRFMDALAKWQQKLGLHQWRIMGDETPASRSNMAEVSYDSESMTAVFRLGKSWVVPPTAADIERTALHELLHLMLSPLVRAAAGKNQADVDAAEHAIINVLEELLVPHDETAS